MTYIPVEYHIFHLVSAHGTDAHHARIVSDGRVKLLLLFLRGKPKVIAVSGWAFPGSEWRYLSLYVPKVFINVVVVLKFDIPLERHFAVVNCEYGALFRKSIRIKETHIPPLSATKTSGSMSDRVCQ